MGVVGLTLPLFRELVRLGPAWGRALLALAGRLRLSADELAATVWLESRGDPAARSPSGRRAGLVQWGPIEAAALGTTVDTIARMSATQQLPLIEATLRPYARKVVHPGDVRLAIFSPAALGFADDDPLSHGAWAANTGLDRDGNGELTAGEVRAQCIEALRGRGRWSLGAGETGSDAGLLLLGGGALGLLMVLR